MLTFSFLQSQTVKNEIFEFRCGSEVYQKYYDDHPEHHISKPKVASLADCSVVKVYYVIPSDAEQRDRAEICRQAVAHVHKNWSDAGRTFDYSEIQIIETPHTQNWWLTNTNNYANDGLQDWEYLSNLEYYLDRNTDYNHNDISNRAIAFIEMKGANAAWGSSGGMCTLPEWAISGAERQLSRGGNMPDVGAVGHELGHAFGIPHRQCNQECAPRSVMCNGLDAACNGDRISYPNVSLSNEDLANLDVYPNYFPELSGCTTTLLSVNTFSLRNKIEIYPKPVEKDLTIRISDLEFNQYNLEIYSLSGQKIYKKEKISQLSNTINLSHISAGTLFFVKIKFDNKTSEVFKIFKV